MSKITVLGTGSWGTILGNLLAENGHEVHLWGNNPAVIDEINQKHTNNHYLTDFTINQSLVADHDLAAALKDTEVVLFVVPTNAIRSVAKEILPYLTKCENPPILVHAAKGIELKTKLRISEVLKTILPTEKFGEVVVISGPSHAEDVAKRDLTALTAASKDLSRAQKIQRLFGNEYFRLYTNTDVVGVEIGAALKNVIAIGAGIVHGLGYGDNTKAALMTRGLAEITRFGVKLGADPLTFSGLSGVGDLIVTCTSVNSRNWRAGNQLGQGQKLADVLEQMGQVVEGVTTAQAVHFEAKDLGVSVPITDSIYEILYEGQDLKEGIVKLMNRDLKAEFN
ncbi:NAD(P)H-dependent glycerol-3-phosphate dehydrogenase [Xylocopilactobacillus apicola]|uniref:Glycerol-3-phosphate dehydrogenase [NAD(P)+] n=1 Tax=Xylocopilactobacillus apicola TaxID=2932184 RepID=A0AAU9D3E7_9LACO|nr:NAD(P)H-dependent glycerol-3-phosphate dehydrogenase [Xylocopilactobacillus apicola]BDR57958.1 glycerol-3-phosphate dehydrogenase [NAD(P)+] [Xylocopilactobacillus apicola]